MTALASLLGILLGWHLRARSERHRRPRLILPGDRVWRFR